jgi:hypothetical protein
MQAHPLATLVSQGAEGPTADHMPLELDASAGPHGTLRGHVARANPLWQAAGHAGAGGVPGAAGLRHAQLVRQQGAHAQGGADLELRRGARPWPAAGGGRRPWLHALVSRLTQATTKLRAASPGPWAMRRRISFRACCVPSWASRSHSRNCSASSSSARIVQPPTVRVLSPAWPPNPLKVAPPPPSCNPPCPRSPRDESLDPAVHWPVGHLYRHAGPTTPAASRASRVMRAQSPAATASAGVSHEPPQTFTLGSARNCGAVSRRDAAGGAEHHVGERPAQRLQHRDAAGRGGREELQEVSPSAWRPSPRWRWPRRAAAAGRCAAGRAHLGGVAGADAKAAAGVARGLRHRPRCGWCRRRRWPRARPAMASMHCSATGVRSVTSSTFTPPATRACASGTASCTRCSTMTGITGPWRPGPGCSSWIGPGAAGSAVNMRSQPGDGALFGAAARCGACRRTARGPGRGR